MLTPVSSRLEAVSIYQFWLYHSDISLTPLCSRLRHPGGGHLQCSLHLRWEKTEESPTWNTNPTTVWTLQDCSSPIRSANKRPKGRKQTNFMPIVLLSITHNLSKLCLMNELRVNKSQTMLFWRNFFKAFTLHVDFKSHFRENRCSLWSRFRSIKFEGDLILALQVYLPSAMFVIVSWVSFLVKPEVVPGRWKNFFFLNIPRICYFRMAMLVTLFLVLINIFNSVR